MNRDERIKQLVLHMFTYQMAERIVDLEDEVAALVSVDKDRIKALENQELDPERVESALRMYVAELDYDIHKGIQCGEEDGLDRYPEEAEYFLRCWETAGES